MLQERFGEEILAKVEKQGQIQVCLTIVSLPSSAAQQLCTTINHFSALTAQGSKTTAERVPVGFMEMADILVNEPQGSFSAG